MSDPTLSGEDSLADVPDDCTLRSMLAITWCPDAPHRVGEVLVLPEPAARITTTLGRTVDPLVRSAWFQRLRPGLSEDTGPIQSRRISREQLRLTPRTDGTVEFENVGRCQAMLDGEVVQSGALAPGQTLTLRKALQLVCLRRPWPMESGSHFPKDQWPAFGQPDGVGMVGESAVAWAVRERLAFCAHNAPHVLIRGPSGSGKELAARALHALSDRAPKPWVSRSAATLPDGLVDAELFGNVANYPNPGMQPRPGLFGEADGGTVFLDEIGELPVASQAHLLRVMDDGELTRLGEARPRQVDVRVVAATNRAASELKHDLAARFPLQVALPPLDQRVEDIPLLVRSLVRSMAQASPDAQRCLDDNGHPRVSAELMAALVGRPWTTHVRELERVLWQALAERTRPDRLTWSSVLDTPPARPSTGAVSSGRTTLPDKDAVQAALERNGGVLEKTWRDLGLRNRYQLHRLVKKYGLRS